jgi:hypothetical protein
MSQNTRLEIILNVQGTNYYLDTDGIEAIPLTFNVANFKDISQTKGSFSKTIVVPETTNNRAVFNNITDLNSQSTFNPNLRNRAYVLVDSICVFDGYFQLSSFQIDNFNYKNSLSLYLTSDTSDFYTVIGEDFIDAMDFSRYNHLYSYNNIVSSWDNNWASGYYYPLIDYGKDWSIADINGSATNSYVSLDQMYPAVYARTIFDKIFNEAGFQYKSYSLTNIVPFNDLVIPFNGKDITNDQNYADLHGFLVGSTYSGTTGQTIQLQTDYTSTGHNTYTNQTTSSLIWNVQPGGSYPFSPAGTYYWSDAWSLTTTQKVKFSDETTPPFGDPNNLWNLTNYQYTNTSLYPITERFNVNMTLFMKFRYSLNNSPKVRLKRQYDASGNYYPSGYEVQCSDQWSSSLYLPVGRAGATTLGNTVWSYLGYWDGTASIVSGYFAGVIPGSGAPGSPGYTPAQPWNNYEVYPNHNRLGYTTKYEVYSGSWNTPVMTIQPGEKVWLEFEYPIAGDTLLSGGSTAYYKFPAGYTLAGIAGGGFNQTGTYPVSFGKTSFGNEIQKNVVPGNEIIFNSVIPKQIKKRDFILSIIKMFNLIVEPDKNNPKLLNIETADYYYSSGVIKDWTSKVDFTQPIDVQVLGDVQNKRFTFKYKDDKDYLNTDYTSLAKKTYGEKQKLTESEFADGEKKIEVIFSPTPLIAIPYSHPDPTSFTGLTYSSIVIPKIVAQNNGVVQTTQSNIRILLKKKIALTTAAYWKLQSNTPGLTLSTTSQTAYPYAGHFNDPGSAMSYDINWDQTEYLYFPNTKVINNGLYLKYWQKTIEEITDRDSRIITLNAYLNAQDIADLRFNDKIYIDINSPAGGGSGGQYFKINKIDNYDPTMIGTCKVELIRTRDITVPKAGGRIILSPTQIGVPVLISAGTTTQYSLRVSNQTSTTATSQTNVNLGANSVVSGTNNVSSGDASLVQGTSNNSAGNRMAVIGSNNTVSSVENTSNVLLGNANTTLENVSNSFIIGNNSTLQNADGAIAIGNGLFLDQTNTTQIGGIFLTENNFITASRNQVLNPFSDNSIINYISGGRNAIRNLGSFVNVNIITAGRNSII